jgi:hypothetical protein
MSVLLFGLVWISLVLYQLTRILRQVRPPGDDSLANIGATEPGRRLDRRSGPQRITVVDDGSEDGTAAAVRRQVQDGHPAELIAAGALPEGWLGKPYACWVGALVGASAWLCFIDADVSIDARLVASAIEPAKISTTGSDLSPVIANAPNMLRHLVTQALGAESRSLGSITRRTVLSAAYFPNWQGP